MHDEKARVRWQCRRGMLELDVLLSNFFEDHYTKLSTPKREAFKKLLRCSDQNLFNWFLKNIHPSDPELFEIIQMILQTPKKAFNFA